MTIVPYLYDYDPQTEQTELRGIMVVTNYFLYIYILFSISVEF